MRYILTKLGDLITLSLPQNLLEKPFHRHKLSDFAPWVPLNMMETMSWARLDGGTGAESETWKVNVEERLEDTDSDHDQTLWDIIPTSNSPTEVNLCQL